MASVSQQAPGKTVTIQLLGQRMALRAGQDPKHIERLASYVRRKGDEIAAAGPVNSTKLAVLVALNIAEDYFAMLEDTRALRREVGERAQALLQELDALDGHRP
jgi:cell division protein ZapA (FtsZ GTPase activity inhibitor)